MPVEPWELQMSEPLVPTAAQAELLAQFPQDQPLTMINLLLFKEPDGAAHYARYAREVQPHLERVGATPIYAGTAGALVIGESLRPWWDAIIVVRYPTRQAFVDMATGEGYAEVHEHRAAALERTELIATSAWAIGS
jgi:uncharacterized protein (DUF1330 family)